MRPKLFASEAKRHVIGWVPTTDDRIGGCVQPETAMV